MYGGSENRAMPKQCKLILLHHFAFQNKIICSMGILQPLFASNEAVHLKSISKVIKTILIAAQSSTIIVTLSEQLAIVLDQLRFLWPV